jgi:glycosyltransferase involved in cell wall biosynthesis
MDKFSVIIPTMWKSEYTIELLQRYSQSKYVGEVILINNNEAETPQISKHDKLKVITPKDNIYVNPAWNLGIELSSNKNITISNDDILFDIDEYYQYLEQTKEILELGFIGSHSDNYTLTESKDVKIELYDNKNNVGGWGCLFSFSKELWKPIPEVLKIWYGDNWIHGTNQLILQLRGLTIQTRMSTTSDLDEVRDVRDNDTIQWHKLLNNL